MLLNLKIKDTLIFLMVCFSLVGTVFAETFGAFTGQINANGINVRVDATVVAEVICTLAKGELVEVVWEAYDWYKIRLPVEAPSYIKKNLCECNNVNTDFASQSGKCLSAKVIKDRVNIRLGPTESAWILGKVDKATVVNVIADEEGWYKIHPVYQSYAWVNKKFVNKEVVLFQKQDAPVKVTDTVKLNDQLVVEGKVSPYGIVLWRKATHKLITSENKIYFLKGDRKSLDSLNYRKVKVTGKLISLAASKYPIIQIDIIEALN
ncbi:MAG: SH3 domain-containing protein [Candidatus Omnitrophota bacterium]|nr:SH3 domain-containing protein [Candidatus Omnitrophota bacterium]